MRVRLGEGAARVVDRPFLPPRVLGVVERHARPGEDAPLAHALGHLGGASLGRLVHQGERVQERLLGPGQAVQGGFAAHHALDVGVEVDVEPAAQHHGQTAQPVVVVERDDLGDGRPHRQADDMGPADAPAVEDGDRVGGQLAEAVGVRGEVAGGGAAGVAVVVADDVEAAVGQPPGELVGPAEGGEVAAHDEQQRRVRRVTEVVAPQLDVPARHDAFGHVSTPVLGGPGPLPRRRP